jgi:hypothetical protein
MVITGNYRGITEGHIPGPGITEARRAPASTGSLPQCEIATRNITMTHDGQ